MQTLYNTMGQIKYRKYCRLQVFLIFFNLLTDFKENIMQELHMKELEKVAGGNFFEEQIMRFFYSFYPWQPRV